MKRPRGWNQPFDVGKYWRCALVLFFNYGLDTGTVWPSKTDHKPILWKHISWDSVCPDGQVKERSRWGWIFYRRVKTGKIFYRPINRTVHAHVKSLKQAKVDPDSQVELGGGCRPNVRFKNLCKLAGLSPKKCLGCSKTYGRLVPRTMTNMSRNQLLKSLATRSAESLTATTLIVLHWLSRPS